MKRLKYLTAGESHGRGLLGILEGFPAGVEITQEYISAQLARRQLGYGRSKRMEIEQDLAEIWSGVRLGKTLGSPIGLLLRNRDWENWTKKMSVGALPEKVKKITIPRPGHADLGGLNKFGFDDIRNVLERSSARETAMRVGLASFCRKLLEDLGIEVGSRVTRIYNVSDDSKLPSLSPAAMSAKADLSPVRCLNPQNSAEMVKAIDKAEKAGDSVGGIIELTAAGLPYGLGSYTHWDRKLQARIAAAMLSINAFKGIEIGTGFESAELLGSEIHDEIGWKKDKYIRFSNNAGGIEGGMSNAQPILLRLVMKPIPTLIKPLRSVDINTKQKRDAHKERTDVCAVPAASVISESMLCLVLADALLEKFGGDELQQIKKHMQFSAKY